VRAQCGGSEPHSTEHKSSVPLRVTTATPSQREPSSRLLLLTAASDTLCRVCSIVLLPPLLGLCIRLACLSLLSLRLQLRLALLLCRQLTGCRHPLRPSIRSIIGLLRFIWHLHMFSVSNGKEGVLGRRLPGVEALQLSATRTSQPLPSARGDGASANRQPAMGSSGETVCGLRLDCPWFKAQYSGEMRKAAEDTAEDQKVVIPFLSALWGADDHFLSNREVSERKRPAVSAVSSAAFRFLRTLP